MWWVWNEKGDLWQGVKRGLKEWAEDGKQVNRIYVGAWDSLEVKSMHVLLQLLISLAPGESTAFSFIRHLHTPIYITIHQHIDTWSKIIKINGYKHEYLWQSKRWLLRWAEE